MSTGGINRLLVVVVRGVYLSIDHAGAIEKAFGNLAGPEDIDLILATDAEQIFGIGDWGVGGIEISIGKLAIYTAAGGIDPTRVIPVMLDVGTNRESCSDPMYPGNRHARVRGERYDTFIDAYVKTAARLFPNALLQWEDFGPGNARRILEKYRGAVPYVQRRSAGHRRDHARSGGLRDARLRNAVAESTRGHFWQWHRRHRRRRPDSRGDQ